MEIPQEIDDFIKHSIENTLGLPIPDKSLDLKVQALERSNLILRDKYLSLLSKFNLKDEALELARGEACMNAQAIKKFVEENQKLAAECANLVSQCSKWEKECSLYDHDREALMEFGNEADERAKEAEIKVFELEEKLKDLSEEAKQYKHQHMMLSGGSFDDGTLLEQKWLNTMVANLVTTDDVAKTASSYLEANNGIESCRELLKMWNRLRPETKNIISLATQVRALQKDKEHLRINLRRAEEEVGVLAAENNVLDEENKRLVKLYSSERRHASSGGRHDSSTKTKKNNKRKTSPVMSSAVDRKIDTTDLDALRCPLSPLKENSPGTNKQQRNDIKKQL